VEVIGDVIDIRDIVVEGDEEEEAGDAPTPTPTPGDGDMTPEGVTQYNSCSECFF
jgi:hypothetical protein